LVAGLVTAWLFLINPKGQIKQLKDQMVFSKSNQNETRTSNFFGISSLQVLSRVKFKSLFYNEILAHFSIEIPISICQTCGLFSYFVSCRKSACVQLLFFFIMAISHNFCHL